LDLHVACLSWASQADVTMTKVGQWGTDQYTDVVVAGDYAYATTSSTGLEIIDIRNPAAPTFVGSYDTSGGAYDIAVASNYAFVADGVDGSMV